MIIIIFSLPILSYATSLSENLEVERVKWDQSKDMYRVSLKGKAAIYFSDLSHLECLKHSITNQNKVGLTYDAKSLTIMKCTIQNN